LRQTAALTDHIEGRQDNQRADAIHDPWVLLKYRAFRYRRWEKLQQQ
jgi:hypothetical protein